MSRRANPSAHRPAARAGPRAAARRQRPATRARRASASANAIGHAVATAPPPQLALQLQRHEQPPEQRKYTSDCGHDCDLCYPGSSRDERCELQWGDPAHWVRRPDGSRVWVTPPSPWCP